MKTGDLILICAALIALFCRGRYLLKAIKARNSSAAKAESFMVLVIILVWGLVYWATR